MMKVNRFEMLIKFAAICICINFFVFSLSAAVPLSSENNLDKETSPATAAISKEDYDEKSSVSDQLPEIFPENATSVSSKNETALEILRSNSSSDVNKTEEKSANNNENKEIIQDNTNKSNNGSKEADYDDHEVSVEKKKEEEEEVKKEEIKKEEKTNNQDQNEKDYDEQQSTSNDEADVENIQDENQEQGDLEEKFGLNSTSINVFEEPTLKGGHIALIFALSLIILSAIAYAGLVMWRKNLEHRYGMRQRLVTEDDYYNNNDVRFFGL